MSFNINRFLLLLKQEFNYWRRPALFLLLSVVVFLSCVAVFMRIIEEKQFLNYEFHITFFPLVLLGVGLVMVSACFRNLNTKEGRSFYLMTPASTEEKYLSKFFITFIVLPLLLIVTYFIFAFIMNQILMITSGVEIPSFRFFENDFVNEPTPYDWLKIFIVLHAVFFLGSITFRKLEFPKTMLVCFLILLVLGFVFNVIIFLFLPEFFNEVLAGKKPPFEPSESLVNFTEHTLSTIIKTAFYFVFPLVLWIAAYFKLIEKEA